MFRYQFIAYPCMHQNTWPYIPISYISNKSITYTCMLTYTVHIHFVYNLNSNLQNSIAIKTANNLENTIYCISKLYTRTRTMLS